jgi:sterol desaturase/sphingolipid hydroxylase (fatty acid hydroxylase superfamily)
MEFLTDLTRLADAAAQTWHGLPLGFFGRQFVRALVLGIGLFIVIYGLECACSAPRSQYTSASLWHDVAYWFYYRTGLHSLIFLATIAGALSEFRALNMHLLANFSYPVQAVIYLLVVDFLAYWIHRAQHRFKWLWAFHTTHHSQRQISFVTSHRIHPVDHLVQYFLQFIPLLLLGFDQAAWLPMYLLGAFIEASQHSRLGWRYGPLYRVVVSPAFHAYHHSSEPAHRDKNFAGFFSVWDYLFGTAVKDDSSGPSRFGLESLVPTTLASTIVAPFRLVRESYGSTPAREQ